MKKTVDSSTMADAAPAVRIAAVSREFGSVIAVNDVSLDIREGEVLTLLGPSGCGKTTLLNLIAGFLEPTRGRIEIAGGDVTGQPPYLRDTGMVFQNYALFPHMSVADNIAFGLKMRKVPRREIPKRVEEALEMVKLAGYGGRRVRQLSGGQQQRVALARALVIRPKVLLLDEPLSALDKNLRGEMQIELKQLQARIGITTVFVTHDQGEALSLSDRIVVLNQGRVQQIADPIGLYRRPANSFVASFIGEINHLPGRIAVSGKEGMVFELANGARLVETARDDLTGLKTGSAHLFVRPEYISPAREGEAENVLEGTVDTHIYQGTHTQMHVAVEGVGGIELRVPGGDVVERYPSGSSVAVRLDLADCVVLPADEPAP